MAKLLSVLTHTFIIMLCGVLIVHPVSHLLPYLQLNIYCIYFKLSKEVSKSKLNNINNYYLKCHEICAKEKHIASLVFQNQIHYVTIEFSS